MLRPMHRNVVPTYGNLEETMRLSIVMEAGAVLVLLALAWAVLRWARRTCL